jgi:hypothetical protein
MMRYLFTAVVALALSTQPLPAAPAQVAIPDPTVYESLTITGTNGLPEVFEHVKVRDVKPDAITIAHSKGGCRIPFEAIPVEWQTRYGLDADSAASYRAEQEAAEELRRQAQQSSSKQISDLGDLDDASMVIRVDAILEAGSRQALVAASRLTEEREKGSQTNHPTGMEGSREYSRKQQDRNINGRVGMVQGAATPGTTLASHKTSEPRVSIVYRKVVRYEPLEANIVLVDATDVQQGWIGRIYPCGLAGGNHARFATQSNIALTWENKKPEMTLTALKNGFLDAVLSPGKFFHMNNMTFIAPALRDTSYWIGIGLGALVYAFVAVALLRR